MALIDKDNLKANIIKRLGISGEEYLIPAEKAIWDVIEEEPPVQPEILASGEGELNVPGTNAGDMISRQAALSMRFSEGYNGDGVMFVPLREVTEWIKALPPVQPKRGKWIERRTWSEGYGMGESYGKYWACDQCGREVKGFWNECGNNFCPHCGADMRGEAE